jgi:hypothetical protein
MARLDIIFVGGIGYLGFNLTAAVGQGGANQTGDVMLIQAVLAFLSQNHEPRQAARWAKIPIPNVDGDPNNGIKDAIRKYQTEFISDVITSVQYEGPMGDRRNRLEVPSAFNRPYDGPRGLIEIDGLIHPANYKRRNLSALWGTAFMTITKLYADVQLVDDGVEKLQTAFPQLRQHLLNGT